MKNSNNVFRCTGSLRKSEYDNQEKFSTHAAGVLRCFYGEATMTSSNDPTEERDREDDARTKVREAIAGLRDVAADPSRWGAPLAEWTARESTLDRAISALVAAAVAKRIAAVNRVYPPLEWVRLGLRSQEELDALIAAEQDYEG